MSGHKVSVNNILKIKQEEEAYFEHPYNWNGTILVYRDKKNLKLSEIENENSEPEYYGTYEFSIEGANEILKDIIKLM